MITIEFLFVLLLIAVCLLVFVVGLIRSGQQDIKNNEAFNRRHGIPTLDSYLEENQ